jgi:MULE transposase domain
MAGFVIIIDGTFNTNAFRLPLLAVVGVSNSGKTFFLVFSYCIFESEDTFGLFFNSLKEVVFLKDTKIIGEVNINLLKVVFGD